MTARAYRPDPQLLADASLTTETAFQVRVIELAKMLGWRAYHTFDSRRSEAGFPDLVLVRPPRLVFIELKVGRRKVTDEQRAWLRSLSECREVDAFALRGRPDGLDDLVDLERFLGRRSRSLP